MTPDTNITLADRYVLESPIASGGMATVWQAKDDVLARTVAVKVLHPHLAEDQEFLERFRREALAAAGLSHPNIVSIYDTGSERSADDVPRNFIVMEYCAGGTLTDVIQEHGPLDAQRASGIACGICDALAYAHSSGVVHRDIKPANVLLTSDGTLKVADFGIAKAAFGDGDITTTGSILGTVTYLSPEQVQGEEPSARSDLYSLGVVLYEMLVGRPPFVEESQIAVAMKHARAEPPPPRSIRAGISRPVEAVVMKALQKDPGDRYESAEAMKRGLEGAAGRGGSQTTAFGPQTTAAPPARPSAPGRAPGVAREARSFLPVVLLIVAAILLILFVPRLIDDSTEPDTNGGSLEEPGDGGGGELDISSASDFDPSGDGSEHSEDVPLAYDGDPGTAWTTEGYNASLELLGKPGVGLVFDLGDALAVSSVEISGSAGSLELKASDEEASDSGGYDAIGDVSDVDGKVEIEADGAEGRYWLVWITSLPGGSGGSATISEVRFVGE
ncbi:MAG: protein kinase [Actinomycetota bacterium]|nr:protein kinase [Actinomycetota bacterium]